MIALYPRAEGLKLRLPMVEVTPTAWTPNRRGRAGSEAFARCTLNGDPTTNTPTDDYAETEIGRGLAGEVGRATLETHVTTTLAATGSFTLRCRRIDNSGPNDPVVARETKIIAIKVDSATRTAVGG